MEFLEEINEIKRLKNELKEVGIDYMKYNKQYNVHLYAPFKNDNMKVFL